jgi:hypothetical protein
LCHGTGNIADELRYFGQAAIDVFVLFVQLLFQPPHICLHLTHRLFELMYPRCCG